MIFSKCKGKAFVAKSETKKCNCMNNQRLGLDVADPGKWNDYKRPAFLLPTDKRFAEISAIYYKEMQKRLQPSCRR